ncbi:YciI family protein [Kribbella sp. NPDC051586]|uniref:YciI family protein n=1 Tax=Kribbella sp. NPDC051586 TaxID=3364118 RepID=UPI0037957D2C
MKYVVMIFHSLDRAWTEEDQQGVVRLTRLKRELAESGELVSSEGLLPPEEGRIVQIRDGAQVVTDGPFGEAKEQLAGYFLVDVVDDERAQAVASQVSAAVGDRVELRGTLLSAGMPQELG